MLSDNRKDHVSRAQMLLLLQGGHIGDPEAFQGSVMEHASEVEGHRHLTMPWLPLPPGQLPAPEKVPAITDQQPGQHRDE